MKPFPYAIFRAYDIRGKVSVLTPDVVYATAQALASEFLNSASKSLIIGYDARLTSPSYAHMIEQVCSQAGLSVELIGCCSSPLLYFVARQFAGNGIMITASHNPKSDNGIKWLLDGKPASAEMIQALAHKAARYYQEQNHQKQKNDLQPMHLAHCIPARYSEQYQAALLNDIQIKRPFKVVLDAMHGSAGYIAAEVLRKLGCEVIALRCEPNGHFPEHAPDPSQEKHLTQLKQCILAEQADVGIALDGDGDRLVLCDEHAKVIRADYLIALFSSMTLAQHEGHEIVYDVKCSSLVRQHIEAEGGRAKMIRTGSSFLRRYLLQSEGQAVFGGEYAGHYVFNDGRGYGYDDGLYAALRVLEYAALKQQSIATLMQAYPESYSTEDLYLPIHQVRPEQVLAHVREQSRDISADLSEIDGIRLDFKDGFGIIRASNTGEYFTLRFEAQTPARLQQIRQLFIAMLAPYTALAQDLAQA